MAILSEVSLGDTIHWIVVDHNPATTNTDATRGSMIVWVNPSVSTHKPVLFYKLDDGSTANVETITKRDNYTATVNPVTTDNFLLGYSLGSKWYNTTTGKLFEMCAVGTPPTLAATWVQLN